MFSVCLRIVSLVSSFSSFLPCPILQLQENFYNSNHLSLTPFSLWTCAFLAPEPLAFCSHQYLVYLDAKFLMMPCSALTTFFFYSQNFSQYSWAKEFMIPHQSIALDLMINKYWMSSVNLSLGCRWILSISSLVCFFSNSTRNDALKALRGRCLGMESVNLGLGSSSTAEYYFLICKIQIIVSIL